MKKYLSSPWTALILIALTAVIIYSNIYESPFIFDDKAIIIKEVERRDLSSYFSPIKRILRPRAIVNLTFVLNYKFGKQDVFGYHLVNVLIHIINGFLVYFLALTIFQRLFSASQPSNRAGPGSLNHSIPIMSLFAALIYIAHPLQIQAVTYTVQRYTSMAAMFFLASVLFYLKARIINYESEPIVQRAEDDSLKDNSENISGDTGGRWTKSKFYLVSLYVLSAICGILALLWFFVLFVLLFLFILFISGFFSGEINVSELIEDISGLTRETERVSRWRYLCTQFNVLVIYIRLLFLPVYQNVDYGYPFKQGFFDGYTPFAFLFLTGLIALGLRHIKKRPIIPLAIFWFFITISVESSLIPIRDAVFEHRNYLPMFGFAILLPYLLFELFSKKGSLAIIICIVIILVFGTATYRRNNVWGDPVTLWKDSLEKASNKARPHISLGEALVLQGRTDEGIDHFLEALRIKPGYVDAYGHLGIARAKQGKMDEAVEAFLAALRIHPDNALAHSHLGNALRKLGRIDEAIKHYSEALRITPNDPETRNGLALVMAGQGRLEEAITLYSKALNTRPDFAEVHNNMGVALAGLGRSKEAVEHLSKALSIKHDYVEAYVNLGVILAQQGKLDGAASCFSKALQIKPDTEEARRNLDILLRLKAVSSKEEDTNGD